MLSVDVLVIDLCPRGSCEHFDGLGRWLSDALTHIRVARDHSSAFESWRGPAPDIVVAHAPTSAEADDLHTRALREFPSAAIFVLPHRHSAGLRPCVPDDVIDALRARLPRALGSLPYQVLPGVIGCSAAVSKAAGEVRLMSASDAVCLLLGETGTGKELFARAIHYLGGRKNRPFVPVNCGAIQDTLFENEMFGHVRGAFTDARDEKPGLLAHAESGTIFLDEVDCLSASAQVKVLRVLQEREYRPVGSTRSQKADVRIIAATNSDLRLRVQRQMFREDLFHRLNVLRVFIPPLRDRSIDVVVLARTFVRDFARQYQRPPLALNDDAYAAIERYHWPGNVREMQAVLERAVLLACGGTITAADLDLPGLAPAAAEAPSMQRAKAHAIELFEHDYLRQVMLRCAGNVSLAARIAGKERRSFQRLLRKHNLTGAEFREGAAFEPQPAAEKP
jgi:two-component system, NtrC family, response regulator GlrR